MSVYEDKDERESFEAPYSGLMRGRSIFEMLSPEVLCLILEFLPAKTLLNLSETSRKFNSECIGNDGVWKDLLKVRFVKRQLQLILYKFGGKRAVFVTVRPINRSNVL